MSGLDWFVLVSTLGLIGVYGTWKSRGVRDMGGYFRDRSLHWPTIGLSIMASAGIPDSFRHLGSPFCDIEGQDHYVV